MNRLLQYATNLMFKLKLTQLFKNMLCYEIYNKNMNMRKKYGKPATKCEKAS